jgi:hypothetical protein
MLGIELKIAGIAPIGPKVGAIDRPRDVRPVAPGRVLGEILKSPGQRGAKLKPFVNPILFVLKVAFSLRWNLALGTWSFP